MGSRKDGEIKEMKRDGEKDTNTRKSSSLMTDNQRI